MPQPLPPIKTMVIANPLAGSRGARWRRKTPASVLAPLFPDAELYFTTCAGDATRVAQEAAREGYGLVVAAGGDGTVNEVANGLVHTDSQMAIFPLGTENVLAKERHIPAKFEKAAAFIRRTKPRQMDLGKIGDRYFVCFAGIGFDALVVEKVKQELKARFGPVAYMLTAMEQFFKYNEVKRRFRITVDDEILEVDSWQVLIGNIQTYGGGLKIWPRASMHDGLLDLVVLPRADIPGMLHQVVSAATGAHLKIPEVRYYQGRKFQIECDTPVSFECDGDLGGLTPFSVELVPKALWVRF